MNINTLHSLDTNWTFFIVTLGTCLSSALTIKYSNVKVKKHTYYLKNIMYLNFWIWVIICGVYTQGIYKQTSNYRHPIKYTITAIEKNPFKNCTIESCQCANHIGNYCSVLKNNKIDGVCDNGYHCCEVMPYECNCRTINKCDISSFGYDDYLVHNGHNINTFEGHYGFTSPFERRYSAPYYTNFRKPVCYDSVKCDVCTKCIKSVENQVCNVSCQVCSHNVATAVFTFNKIDHNANFISECDKCNTKCNENFYDALNISKDGSYSVNYGFSPIKINNKIIIWCAMLFHILYWTAHFSLIFLVISKLLSNMCNYKESVKEQYSNK